MEVGYGTLEAKDDYAPVLGQSPSDDALVGSKKQSKKYPYGVLLILSNEFCERFSYYGMRAILVIYLSSWLKFPEDEATSIFHAFSMMCYLMPLIGAVIADGYLGRYWTILSLSIVYFIGSVVMATTSLPPPGWVGAACGLLLIAVGTGGIKSSVAPFGADQFGPGMEKWQNSFFSAFYFMINLGSMISIIISPILRADVTCFGGDCYFLAFGVSAILMLISVGLFFLGRNMYVKVPPTGNVIGKTFKCIWYGIKGRICSSHYEEPRKHWLYYADNYYDSRFIDDVHQLLKMLTMFIPLPIFWALSDQQGSRWTLQAEHVDGDMGVFGSLKPDQVQALNPVLILLLIPLFDKAVYPLMDRCKIPNRPLQRMAVGLLLTSAAFMWAGFVQIKIDNTEEPGLGHGESAISLLNTLPCSVKVQSPVYTGHLASYQKTDGLVVRPGAYKLKMAVECLPGQVQKINPSINLAVGSAYRLFIHTDVKGNTTLSQFPDQRNKPSHGDAAVSLFSSADLNFSMVSLMSSHNDQVISEVGTLINLTRNTATEFRDMSPGVYHVYRPDNSSFKDLGLQFSLRSGGVYTAVITGPQDQLNLQLFVDVSENKVSVAWMIPQYVLITLAEVLFSISGLSFAYTQAPASLKSVVQAIWLLTVSMGDLVVIIVANIQAITTQRDEFFVFAVLMLLSSLVFISMATCYTYKPNSLYKELSEESSDEDKNGLVKRPQSVTETLPLSTLKKADFK